MGVTGRPLCLASLCHKPQHEGHTCQDSRPRKSSWAVLLLQGEGSSGLRVGANETSRAAVHSRGVLP